jgi:hypothetical protein
VRDRCYGWSLKTLSTCHAAQDGLNAYLYSKQIHIYFTAGHLLHYSFLAFGSRKEDVEGFETTDWRVTANAAP